MSARVAVLVSGGGTNLQAILDAAARGELPSAQIALVVSSRADAYALERARNAGVKTAVCPRAGRTQAEFEADLEETLCAHGIELIVLAGFMTILSAAFVQRYPEQIINVHPSLIPSFCGEGFYGLRVHRAALDYGVKVTGATVHFVNEIPDGGRIIAQKAVDIQTDDTPQTLQRRVMEQAEWVLLPRAVEEVASKMGGKGMKDLFQAAGATTYPGRGIVAGRTADGGKAFFAYFIMGRSANSRNRVFVRDGDGIRTQAFDPAAMKDPSLIIYAPVRWQGGKVVVTNGDQTDTICDFLAAGKSFGDALRTRAFEPDAPNFTPRISLIAEAAGKLAFSMAILKAADDSGARCLRCFYEYEDMPAGEGRFIHTYRCDGNPIPSFEGEPEAVALAGDLDALTEGLWNALDADNRVSLWTMTVDLTTGDRQSRIVNRNA